jgi:hypothetical protein
MSKELEEAAENYAVQYLIEDEQEIDSVNRKQSFKAGATYMAERMYSYDELRRIAYNAYCFGQFEGTTEGKFNKWIVEFKK